MREAVRAPEPRLDGVAARELVLASAGSGKTYQLSSRLIGLLAAGAPPEEILASTFTRKAAGEILDRVLLRLAAGALSDDAAAELQKALPAIPPERLSREACGALLARVVGSLHRLQVHTLDAFFHRMVRAFALELGLPGEWTVADEPTGARLRARALDEALADGDDGVLIELVRLAGRGDADRSVHELLSNHVAELHALYHELVPGGDERWGGALTDGAEGPTAAEIDAAAREIAALELPMTKAGTPRKAWVQNVERIVEAAGGRDWDTLLDCTLVQRVIADDLHFSHAPVGPEICAPVGVLVRAAVAEMRPLLRSRVRALGRFLPEYDRRLARLRRDEGAYGFDDLVRVLLDGPPLDDPAGIHYRIDGRIRHVLLDEFQDTSTVQWAALEPLVGEILSGYEGERAAFVVADPKQSIYGWRDGEPRILDRIREHYGLRPTTLARSWRSSPVVLEMVNRVFEGVAENPVVADDEAVRRMAGRWAEGFEPHRAQHEHLPGFATLRTGPSADDAGPCVSGSPLLAHVAREVADLRRRIPGASIGILTRKNVTVARLIAELRELGVEASEEGGVPVADSPAVVAVLALLRFVDHPGDRISRYLVARSALGGVVGLDDWRTEGAAERVGARVRAELLHRGYGAVLAEWARALDPHLSPRDRRRLQATVELAHRWDDRATLRPADFVRLAESTRAEDPSDAGGVRLMTVHRAKGLEFDVVVLPELDGVSLTAGGLPPFVPEREAGGAGPVRRILPGVARHLEPLFPELETAADQHRESVIRDALSTVYVALTRARFAVHAFVEPDPDGRSTARSAARLLREALAPDVTADPERELWRAGEPGWWAVAGAPERLAAHRPVPDVSGPSAPRLVFAPPPRRRRLDRRSPSELEGGERVSLADLLRPIPPDALVRGGLVHAWLEAIEWLGPEGPDRARCLEIARARAPSFPDPEGLFASWAQRLQAPAVRALLSRDAFAAGTRVERELAFLARYRGGLLHGVADRVLRVPSAEGDRLIVIDWKTDRLPEGPSPELERRVAFYRPQLEAYRAALAEVEAIEPSRVDARLAFLEAGVVRRLEG